MQRRSLLRRPMYAVLCGALVFGVVGAAAAAERTDSSFPSQEELEELKEQPAPEQFFGQRVAPVDEWTLQGPFPAKIDDRDWTPPDDPWQALVRAAAQRRAGLVVPTEAMHCIAREVGLFVLAKEGRPDAGLLDFIAARCRSTAAGIGFSYMEGAFANPDPALILEHWSDDVAKQIDAQLSGGPRSLGLWFGSNAEGRTIALVAHGMRSLSIDELTPQADAEGRIEIRGSTLQDSAGVFALVNRGRYDVRECKPQPGSELPNFHLVCEIEPGAGDSPIDIGLSLPGRVLGRKGTLILASPAGRDAASRYVFDAYVPPHEIEDAESIAGDFVELLNQVRREAGLGKLELDRPMSAVATELAPHYFAAIFDAAPEVRGDVVLLGMLAGWWVDGIVAGADFASAWQVQSKDLGRLLSEALARPSARSALLDANAGRIAVGPMLATREDQSFLSLIAGTYTIFAEEDHERSAQQVIERLSKAREKRGHPAAKRIEGMRSPCQQAAAAIEAGRESEEVLEDLLSLSAQLLRRPVSGWLTEVSDLDDIEFPESYLDDPDLEFEISVTHRRKEGEAWGRHVVLLIVAGSDGVES